MSDIAKYFETLMTTPCKVYLPTYTKASDGTSVRSFSDPVITHCNFHSANKSKTDFAGQTGETATYVVCLPFGIQISKGCFIEINEGDKYRVIGVREASRKFEIIAEVVAYE